MTRDQTRPDLLLHSCDALAHLVQAPRALALELTEGHGHELGEIVIRRLVRGVSDAILEAVDAIPE